MNSRYAVLGAGLMGVGIAVHFARYGHDIWLYDTDPQRLTEIPAVAGRILDELVVAGRCDSQENVTTLAHLHGTLRLSDLANCELVIEAIPEQLARKHALYQALEAVIAPEAIIASNTSGLPPDSLAQPLLHPERLLIAHFWNPPHFIPLVELVPGTASDERHLDDVQKLLLAMDLEAVRLKRAAPGFIGNRLQFALLREALHIVHSGIAEPQVVDRVIRASLGRRYAMVGPLEAADMTGLATVSDICRHLLPELATGTEMLALVEELVQHGAIGERSGDGFYLWDEDRKQRIQERRAYLMRHALKP